MSEKDKKQYDPLPDISGIFEGKRPVAVNKRAKFTTKKEKAQQKVILILAVLLVAVTAVLTVTLKIADAKKPRVTHEKATVETIKLTYTATGLIQADGLTTRVIFIDNDYDIHHISKRLKAEITIGTDNIIEGTVTDIREEKPGDVLFNVLTSTLLDTAPDTSIYSVTLTMDDDMGILRNNETVSASVIIDSSKNALTVPTSALFTSEEGTYVWIFHPVSKKLTAQNVTTGIVSDGKAEITDGLSKHDRVITGASCTSSELYNGIKVKVKQ